MYSVVVPVYNSEPSLKELFDGILQVFGELKEDFEVIFVDDGSRDGSWKVLQGLKKEHPDQVTAVSLAKNFGQHNATLCGFSLAKGDCVISIDDDLQVPPAEIRKLIQCRNETDAEIVYGVYGPGKQHSAIRNAGSRLTKKTSVLMTNGPGEGSSFRLIRTDLVKKILNHHQNFIYIDEIILWYTDSIAFENVEHHKRKYRQSGYTLTKLVKLAGNILLYYSTLPLKVLVYGGFITSFIFSLIGVWFIVKKLFFNVPLGYTSLIVAIVFSTGIILFSLGVIGEYLSRIYQIQNKKPPYSIRVIL
ncbi:MAG TPA: glycosyltransferase family 2 protein [Bacteroidales bacterium]|nr:glycosyltransferase family 2 protein [Bacteroidales bacterium]